MKGDASVTHLFDRNSKDNGFTMPLLVLMLVFCVIVTAGFIEFASITSAKCVLDSKLSNVKESSCSTSFALLVKNSDDPGEEIAQKICNLIRENGITGACKLWVYEAPKDSISADERLILWMAEATIDHQLLTSGLFGANNMSISSNISGSYKPYSDTITWRPQNSGCGVYSFSKNSTSFSYAEMSDINNYPSKFVQLIANSTS